MAVSIKKYKPKESYLKCAIVWDAGSWKTTLSSTISNPLFICTENGLLSIADKEPLMIEIGSVQDLRETLKYLQTELAKPKEQREIQFDAIIIDSLSEMAVTIKDKLTQWGTNSMSMRDWGILGDQLMGIFRAFIALPCHVIALSHIKESQDEKTGAIIYDLSLPGRSKEEALRAFDIIAYLWKNDDGSRTISAKESPVTKAKCRSQALKKAEPLPFDLNEWIKIINEGTTFWDSEEVAVISNTKPAPTEAVKKMWDMVEVKLMENNSPEAKASFKEQAASSTKINSEEKAWVIEMINNY